MEIYKGSAVNRFSIIKRKTLHNLTGFSFNEFDKINTFLTSSQVGDEYGMTIKDQLLITLNKYHQNLDNMDIGKCS